MHPELEDFLEEAFEPIQSTASSIGRVVVEPDYDTAPDESESTEIRRQLENLLKIHTTSSAELKSAGGVDVEIGADQPLLKKYLRKVTLHSDPIDGPWIEVSPPGNWI